MAETKSVESVGVERTVADMTRDEARRKVDEAIDLLEGVFDGKDGPSPRQLRHGTRFTLATLAEAGAKIQAASAKVRKLAEIEKAETEKKPGGSGR